MTTATIEVLHPDGRKFLIAEVDKNNPRFDAPGIHIEHIETPDLHYCDVNLSTNIIGGETFYAVPGKTVSMKDGNGTMVTLVHDDTINQHILPDHEFFMSPDLNHTNPVTPTPPVKS